MKLFFVDDSYRREGILGHGGFVIDALHAKMLMSDLTNLKKEFGIPHNVEVKWSPEPDHFLRTKFKGKREELYTQVIKLIYKYEAKIICAVHDLNECYGRKKHNWSLDTTIAWATAQQFKYLAERFEKPLLTQVGDIGIIIACEEKERKNTILNSFNWLVKFGTEFRDLNNICLNPLLIASRYCSLLEIADIIIGVFVGSLVDNKYALQQFESLLEGLLKDPHEGAIAFGGLVSSSTLGFGLILFPASFKNKGRQLFGNIDKKYIYEKDRDAPQPVLRLVTKT